MMAAPVFLPLIISRAVFLRRSSSARGALSRLRYQRKPFDVAVTDAAAQEAALAVADYRLEDRDNGFHSLELLSFLRDGRGAWHGYKRIFENLAGMAQCKPEDVLLFDSATQCFERLADSAIFQGRRIIFASFEYPVIKTLLRNTAGADEVCEIAYPPDWHRWTAEVIEQHFVESLCAELKKRATASPHQLTIVISHVSCNTGRVINLPSLAQRIRDLGHDVRIVANGVHGLAAGTWNPAILDCCDCYVGSGSKWLGGFTNSGYIIIGSAMTGDAALRCAIVANRAFTTSDYIDSLNGDPHAMTKTPLAPLVGMGVCLSDLARSTTDQIAAHNRELAQQFAERLAPDYTQSPFEIIPANPECGMVVLRMPDSAQSVRRDLFKEENIQGNLLDPSSLRFCFHHFHDSSDVQLLVNALRRLKPLA